MYINTYLYHIIISIYLYYIYIIIYHIIYHKLTTYIAMQCTHLHSLTIIACRASQTASGSAIPVASDFLTRRDAFLRMTRHWGEPRLKRSQSGPSAPTRHPTSQWGHPGTRDTILPGFHRLDRFHKKMFNDPWVMAYQCCKESGCLLSIEVLTYSDVFYDYQPWQNSKGIHWEVRRRPPTHARFQGEARPGQPKVENKSITLW